MSLSYEPRSITISDETAHSERNLEAIKKICDIFERTAEPAKRFQSMFQVLEEKASFMACRLDLFIDGDETAGNYTCNNLEEVADPAVEEVVSESFNAVVRHNKSKMIPIFSNRVEKRAIYGLDRGAQLYSISVPVRKSKRFVGVLSAVKTSFGGFQPKTEMNILSIAASLTACSLFSSSSENPYSKKGAPAALPQPKASAKPRYNHLVGHSKTLLHILTQIKEYASDRKPALFIGENGVGKEILAETMHQEASSVENQLTKLDCRLAPETWMAGELFGCEEGVFNRGFQAKTGALVKASGGTLLLENIDSLSLKLQARLSDYLETGKFQVMGSSENVQADTLVIATAEKDLYEDWRAGLFHDGLYRQLTSRMMHVPPLRERKVDITPLADFFVDRYRQVHCKPIRRISTPALDMLQSYHWPGNIRELEACIENAVIQTTDGVIRGHHLPPSLQMSGQRFANHEGRLQSTLDSMERELILDALKETAGNMAKAARNLGLTERVMGLRTRKYKINPKHLKTNYRSSMH